MHKLPSLQLFGFSQLAEKIYVSLLKYGNLTVAGIATHTGLYRSSVYQTLPMLLSTNLISSTAKGRRTFYQANSPIALRAVLNQRLQSSEKTITEYLSLFERNLDKPKLVVLEGRSGINTAYEELLRNLPKSAALYRYESPKDYKRNKRYYPKLYWRRAGAAGDIKKYVITNLITHKTRHTNLNRNSKAVPLSDETFAYNITQLMTDDTTVFIDFDSETAILIKHQRLAAFQKRLFKLLFERL